MDVDAVANKLNKVVVRACVGAADAGHGVRLWLRGLEEAGINLKLKGDLDSNWKKVWDFVGLVEGDNAARHFGDVYRYGRYVSKTGARARGMI